MSIISEIITAIKNIETTIGLKNDNSDKTIFQRIVSLEDNVDDNSISSTTTWSSEQIYNEFISLMSVTPTLSLPSSANENTNVTITITNYKKNTQYFFTSDAGDITVSDDTATLITNEVDSDTDFTMSCYAVEVGKTRSNMSTVNITVINVPIAADGSINNSDFQANQVTNDGFVY